MELMLLTNETYRDLPLVKGRNGVFLAVYIIQMVKLWW